MVWPTSLRNITVPPLCARDTPSRAPARHPVCSQRSLSRVVMRDGLGAVAVRDPGAVSSDEGAADGE